MLKLASLIKRKRSERLRDVLRHCLPLPDVCFVFFFLLLNWLLICLLASRDPECLAACLIRLEQWLMRCESGARLVTGVEDQIRSVFLELFR